MPDGRRTPWECERAVDAETETQHEDSKKQKLEKLKKIRELQGNSLRG
jgi:hypothetical protein